MTTPVSTKRKASALGEIVNTITVTGASVPDLTAPLVSPTIAHSSSAPSHQLRDNLRRSSRPKSRRKLLNLGDKDRYKYDIIEHESAIAKMDEVEDKGREIWKESQLISDPKERFLKCKRRGPDDWAFFHSKNCHKELFTKGIRGVHYAFGYVELGRMVETYGGDDAANWPSLEPSIKREDHDDEDDDQTLALTVATNAEDKPTGLIDDQEESASLEPPLIKTEEEADGYVGRNDQSLRHFHATSTEKIPTELIDEWTEVQKIRTSDPSITSTVGHALDENANELKEEQGENRVTPRPIKSAIRSTQTRLKLLEEEVFSGPNESSRSQGILKRLETLEHEVLGNTYDKELKGVALRLERLEEMIK